MPSSTTLVALSLLTLGLASPVALETRQLSPPVALVKTLNYLDVVSVKTSNITSTRKLSAARIKNYGSAKLRDLFQEEEWAAKISFGGEEVFVILDTGSSDTWLVESGFQCVNSKGVKQAESKCKFGPVYNGTFKKGEISDVSCASDMLSCGTAKVHDTFQWTIGWFSLSLESVKCHAEWPAERQWSA
jgi:hypothetical protein